MSARIAGEVSPHGADDVTVTDHHARVRIDMTVRPALVVHADWSADTRKRWMTMAWAHGRAWRVEAPEPVGPLPWLLDRLCGAAQGGAVLLGLDLPIGVPRAWALGRPEPDFPRFLRGLSPGDAFACVCATLAEVSPARPFYPLRPLRGITRTEHLRALGFTAADALRRRCDRATRDRPAAAPLFWTVGAQQVGKAALTAWCDVLAPALATDPARLRLWPFEGTLEALVAPGTVVAAETYPAEALRQIGLRLGGSKRARDVRAAAAGGVRAAMERLAARPSPALAACIDAGFGSDAAGEDRFDSLVGCLGMLGVVSGARPAHGPRDAVERAWEGWILGLDPDQLVPA